MALLDSYTFNPNILPRRSNAPRAMLSMDELRGPQGPAPTPPPATPLAAIETPSFSPIAPKESKPQGMLARFLNAPGQNNAMGILGSYLVAAGGEQTNITARNRLLAEGIQQYFGTLTEAKRYQGAREFAESQFDYKKQTDAATAAAAKAEADRKYGLDVSKYGLSTLDYDPESVEALAYAEAAGETAGERVGLPGGAPAFEGTGMPAQIHSKLLRGVQDSSYAATSEYRAAYNIAAEPKRMRDPQTGEFIMHRPDMSAYPLPTGPQFGRQGIGARQLTAPAEPPSPATAIPGLSPDVPVEEAYGLGASVKSKINFLADLVGQPLPFWQTNEAITAMEALKTSTKTFLATERGGRPSNLTLTEIENLLPKPGSAFTGDQKARQKLRVIRDKVEEQYRLAEDYATNPNRRVSPDQRAQAEQDMGQLEQLLGFYNTALEKFSAQPVGALELGGTTTLPSGATIERIE